MSGHPAFTAQARFYPGQLVHHRLFDYRGVVTDVDPTFRGSSDWKEATPEGPAPHDHPWYYVLVHEMGYHTYVAEQNLEPDDSGQPIHHPQLGTYFQRFSDGRYVPVRLGN